MLDRISLILVIIGAINWGSIGLFKFDIVAWICGGQGSIVSRIIYTVVALAGIWCISMLFRENSLLETTSDDVKQRKKELKITAAAGSETDFPPLLIVIGFFRRKNPRLQQSVRKTVDPPYEPVIRRIFVLCTGNGAPKGGFDALHYCTHDSPDRRVQKRTLFVPNEIFNSSINRDFTSPIISKTSCHSSAHL